MYTVQGMKAVRTPLATALFIVVATLYGCGPFFGPSGGPQAPTFDPPAGAYTEEQWIEVSSRTGRVYATTDPDASALEFEPLKEDRIYVPDDMTIRAFVLDDSGLRSAIVAAEYTIDSDDVTAPTISDTSIIQGGIDYFGYDVNWSVTEPDGSNNENPSDDRTDWYDLAFCVYASVNNDIDSIEDAKLNGTLVRDWHSENSSGGVGYVRYEASKAGERRFIHVFVRDDTGNTAAYGAVMMESAVPPPDFALDAQTWLNPQDKSMDPDFSNVGSPPAGITAVHVIALIDMDGDGFDDLVACYDTAADTHQAWFHSIGNGSFEDTPNYFDEYSPTATDLEIADLNQDGTAEIIFANPTGIVSYTQAGSSPLNVLGVGSIDVFEIGDINDDDLPDIVTANAAATDDDVSVWINDGTGGFYFVGQTLWHDYNPSPVDLAIGDLDGDGYNDLVVANGAPTPVQVFYGNGSNMLDIGVVSWPFQDTRRLTLLDWNHDAWLDVVFANGSAGGPNPLTTQIYVSDAPRSYLHPPAYHEATPDDATGIAVADFNDDGYLDFVETFAGSPGILWMNNFGGAPLDVQSLGTGANDVAVGRIR